AELDPVALLRLAPLALELDNPPRLALGKNTRDVLLANLALSVQGGTLASTSVLDNLVGLRHTHNKRPLFLAVVAGANLTVCARPLLPQALLGPLQPAPL